MIGEPYTTEETKIIQRHYPTRGAKVTQRILKAKGYERTVQSVTFKARKLCEFAEVKGYVRLIDVDYKEYPKNRQVTHRALKAAERDGVIKLVKAGELSYRLVPVEWADKYVKESEALWQADEQYGDAWWGSDRVAEEFGLAVRTIQNAVGGRAGPELKKAMQLVTRARGVRQWYFEPGSVRRAARVFRSETR